MVQPADGLAAARIAALRGSVQSSGTCTNSSRTRVTSVPEAVQQATTSLARWLEEEKSALTRIRP
jgi:hypothetical protein